MKKSLKIALIVAVSLVLIGLLCIFIAFCSSGFSVKGMFKQEYETQTLVIENCENLKNIDLNERFFDIALYVSEDNACRIEYPVVENVSLTYQLEKDGNTLINTIVDNRKWYEKLNWDLGGSDHKTKIYLPQKEYETIKIKIASGDIDFKCTLTVEQCEISTSSGDIDYSHSGANHINFVTSSGDIRFTSVSEGDINLATESGDIYVGSIWDASLFAHTSSGDITTKSNSFRRFNLSTESGDITANKTYATDWVGFNSRSGDIEVYDMKSHRIYFTTTSGDVEFDMVECDSIIKI